MILTKRALCQPQKAASSQYPSVYFAFKMTKLGVTPGVHGDSGDEKGEVKPEAIKIDPKVFTVLQPTVIPLPMATPHRSSLCGAISRGLLLFLLFVSCFTAGLVLLYGVDAVYSGIFGQQKDTEVTTTAPLMNQFENINSETKRDEQKKKPEEVSIVMQSIPLARVMVIEGGSDGDGKETERRQNIIDGSVEKEEERPRHPYEMEAPPVYAFNNRPNTDNWMALENRQMEYLQAMRQWRLRRIQQALIEQQLMRESMVRSAWSQQHQQAMAQAQMERAQMIRMEQARMARQRMAEEYQAEMERAQMIQAQMARMQMAQAQQWWQPQVQWWPRQQQNFPQQQYWPQQQYYQNQMYPNQQQPQFSFFRTFPRIIPSEQSVQQNGQIPMRPHDASPQQILNNLQQQPIEQTVVPPAPTPAIHDRIYQEMQKKSQGMEFNAPSRPIWTAITPAQDTAPYDQDAIFQENLKKAMNQGDETTTLSPTEVLPNNEQSKEPKIEQPQQEGENVFRDILSVFDQEEKEKSTTTENVFKAFETEDDKKQPTQLPESATENVFRAFDIDKEKVKDELLPEDDEETATEPVVIEDRFPRIEERTTTPEPEITSTKASNESVSTENDDIVDPLAAFLRFFEQEAQKMTDNKQEAKSVVADKVVQNIQTDPEPEVDVPEPHFQPISELPKPSIV